METTTKRPGRPKDEELVARRRDEILDVAVPLFAGQGYRQTDVQVLADALGVGKGTIYRYFGTKEELFLAAVDRGIRRLKQRIEEESEGIADPLEEMRAAVRAYLSFFDAHPEVVELLIQERAEFKDRKKPTYFVYQEASLERGRCLLSEMMKSGRIRTMPPERIQNVLSDLLYGAIFTNHFAGRRRPFEKQASDILDIVLHGILPRERAETAGSKAMDQRRRKR